jgi:hypothetical protein
MEVSSSGWELGFDLDAENPVHPHALTIKGWRDTHDPPIIGFIQWDCGYGPGEAPAGVHPACTALHSCYYDIGGATILPKPPIQMLINEFPAIVLNQSVLLTHVPFDLPPGGTVSLQFVEADTGGVPDGSCIELDNSGAVTMTQQDKTVLTFQDGVTEEIFLIIPPTGVKSYINLLGCHVCTTTLVFRGWPVT